MINLNNKVQRELIKNFFLKIIEIGRSDSKINKDYCPDFLFDEFSKLISKLYTISED